MAQAWIALIVSLCVAFPAAAAQERRTPSKKEPPAWSELAPEQQKILAPLSNEWNALDATRRKQWIGVATRYPKMTPKGQERVQKRMVEWASLTPEQRRAARERYQQIRRLPTEKRRQIYRQWRAYQRAVASQPGLSPSDAPAPPQPSTAPAIPRSQ